MHCRQIGSSLWNGVMCYVISILRFSFSFLANEPLCLNNNDNIFTLSYSLTYIAPVTSILFKGKKAVINTSAIPFCFKRFVSLCLMFLMIQLLNSDNTRLFKELTLHWKILCMLLFFYVKLKIVIGIYPNKFPVIYHLVLALLFLFKFCLKWNDWQSLRRQWLCFWSLTVSI